MTTTKIKFKNNYSEQKMKDQYWREIKGESKTDQDQLAQASISIMAEKFGIDALISKAKQMQPDEALTEQLYGRDLTLLFNDKAKALDAKRDLEKLFERIPAKMRKLHFNDDPKEFVESYMSGDVEKLTELQKYGLVNELQLNKYKDNIKQIENNRKAEKENEINRIVEARLQKINEEKIKGETRNEQIQTN